MAKEIFDDQFPIGWKDEKPTHLTAGRLALMLQDYFGDRIRFNLVKSKPELDGCETKDNQLQNLYVALSELGWEIGKAAARDTWVSHAIKNEYSPVVEYLEGVLADEAVVPAELDEVAQEYLGATGPTDGAKVAAMLIGAVARAYKPGCKFDYCLTLKGEQGIGKSSFFKELASPKWFVDTMQDNDKDFKLLTHSCWFFELQELESFTGKKEAGKVKAWLSTAVDSFRSPYGYGTDDHPRRSIFVASVNRDDFLRDSTGNRRFWIVDLPHRKEMNERIHVLRVRQERDRIWKAAALAYKSGRPPILTWEQEVQSDKETQEYTQENWCTGQLADWVRWLDHQDAIGLSKRHFLPDRHFTMDMAMEAVRHRASVQQVAEALKQLGCVRHPQRSVRGQRLRLWEAPKTEGFTPEEIKEAKNAAFRYWN